MGKFVLTLIIVIACSNVLLSQQEQKTKLVRLPPNRALVSIVDQANCPLKIVEALALAPADGHNPIVKYVIRNQSRKGITYFSVEFLRKFSVRTWGRFGHGDGLKVGNSDGSGPVLLKPGVSWSNWKSDEYQLVEMTKELEDVLATDDTKINLKIMWVGMITKVVFEDGTVYDASSIYDGLASFWLE